MAFLTQLDVDSAYTRHVLPAVLLIGLGLGTMSPVAANLATYKVPDRDAGIASALCNASEQVGASIGLAVLNTIAATDTNAYLATHPPGPGTEQAGLVHGYTTATTWATAILTLGAILVLALVNARLGPATTEAAPEPPAPLADQADTDDAADLVPAFREHVLPGQDPDHGSAGCLVGSAHLADA